MTDYTILLQQATSKLITYLNDPHEARTVAQWLIEKVTGKSHAQLIAQPTIAQEELDKLEQYIREITVEHKPVQYILSSVPFLNLELLVEPPVLIPRPETEQWVAKLTRDITLDNFSLLDLCSGTGCIGLSIAQAFPNAQIIASDINPQAVALIEKNNHKNGITNCRVIQSDLFENITGKFDFIVANPPYIAHEEWLTLKPHVKNWESPQALVADDEGYALIEKIIKHAHDYLNPAQSSVPQLWIEIGYNQAEHVVQLCYQYGYSSAQVLVDDYGNNRVVMITL